MTVAVVLGRFQIDELHEGHLSLLRAAIERGRGHVLVVLGEPAPDADDFRLEVNAWRNPLSLAAREVMLRGALSQLLQVSTHLGKFRILSHMDVPGDDKLWSDKLDGLVFTELAHHWPEEDAVLLHGRKSFAKHYKGCLDLVEVPEIIDESGSSARRRIHDAASAPPDSADYRRGLIAAARRRVELIGHGWPCHCDGFSDAHKDIHGVRPRNWDYWICTRVREWHDEHYVLLGSVYEFRHKGGAS